MMDIYRHTRRTAIIRRCAIAALVPSHRPGEEEGGEGRKREERGGKERGEGRGGEGRKTEERTGEGEGRRREEEGEGRKREGREGTVQVETKAG